MASHITTSCRNSACTLGDKKSVRVRTQSFYPIFINIHIFDVRNLANGVLSHYFYYFSQVFVHPSEISAKRSIFSGSRPRNVFCVRKRSVLPYSYWVSTRCGRDGWMRRTVLTVDGSEIRRWRENQLSGFVVEIPLFTGFFLHPRWLLGICWTINSNCEITVKWLVSAMLCCWCWSLDLGNQLTLMIWHHQLELHIQTQIHLESSIETSVCKFAK